MAIEKIPLENKIFQNVAESALGILNAAIENCYVTDTGGLARFPRLVRRVTLSGLAPTFLEENKGDLIAVSGGRVYRINPESFVADDVTAVAVSGSGRCTFAETDRGELLMAAGRSIVRLAAEKTDLLSAEAPETTHVGFVGGYALAIEPRSGRFRVSNSGQYSVWDALDVLSAEGNPDNITCMIVSEFGELLLGGPKSLEQFDQAPNGARPFFKRWGLGTGIYAPYTLLSESNQIWGLNNKKEWVAFSSQIGAVASEDIQNTLSTIDDWTDAWATALQVAGQRFMIIQAPYATNPYQTKGITLLFDYRKRRWGSLYGWDEDKALPTRWEGWSYKEIGSKKFVGGNGCVYELTGHSVQTPQRMLWRSGHISRPGNAAFCIQGLEMRLERGEVATGLAAPQISVRANKDNRGFGRWARGSMGKTGDRGMRLHWGSMGNCESVQFEIQITDSIPVNIARFDMDVTPV